MSTGVFRQYPSQQLPRSNVTAGTALGSPNSAPRTDGAAYLRQATPPQIFFSGVAALLPVVAAYVPPQPPVIVARRPDPAPQSTLEVFTPGTALGSPLGMGNLLVRVPTSAAPPVLRMVNQTPIIPVSDPPPVWTPVRPELYLRTYPSQQLPPVDFTPGTALGTPISDQKIPLATFTRAQWPLQMPPDVVVPDMDSVAGSSPMVWDYSPRATQLPTVFVTVGQPLGIPLPWARGDAAAYLRPQYPSQEIWVEIAPLVPAPVVGDTVITSPAVQPLRREYVFQGLPVQGVAALLPVVATQVPPALFAQPGRAAYPTQTWQLFLTLGTGLGVPVPQPPQQRAAYNRPWANFQMPPLWITAGAAPPTVQVQIIIGNDTIVVSAQGPQQVITGVVK